MTATSRRLHHVGTLTPVSNMTARNLRLAEEIDAAVDKYGLGNNHRMFTGIKFFEGELSLIDCRLLALRGAAEGRKAARQHSRSGHTGRNGETILESSDDS